MAPMRVVRKRSPESLRRFKASLRRIGVLPQAPLSDPLPLHDIYEDTFKLVRATTQELKEAAYRLRYQVYCVENSYERPDEQMGGRETDLYDDRSVHALLIHKRSGAVAGTVRVILPEADTQGLSLPIKVVTDSHHRELLRRLPYSQTAEISRFAV